jgi:hypothetical protein
MSIMDFLKALLRHAALAGGFWLLVCLVLERLAPGFVSPFINLPQAALFMGIILLFTAAVPMSAPSRTSFWVSLCGLIGIFILSVLFVWTRVNAYGSMGVLLVLGLLMLGGLILYSFVRSRNTS